jgi:hypothetical protein
VISGCIVESGEQTTLSSALTEGELRDLGTLPTGLSTYRPHLAVHLPVGSRAEATMLQPAVDGLAPPLLGVWGLQPPHSALLKLLCGTMSDFLCLHDHLLWHPPHQTLWQDVPRLPEL